MGNRVVIRLLSAARTLKPSPSGWYLFVACNSASGLYVVRTSDMKVIASMPVDSYPVGLDVSADVRMVAVASQGRSGHGGSAVIFFEIDYRGPEPVVGAVSELDSVTTALSPDADDGDVGKITGGVTETV